jgi:hypothetical protein
MTATAITLAEQIGRYWAANSALGLSFAEPRDAVKANIAARSMPDKDHRLSPGVSITPTPVAPSEDQVPTHAIGLAVEVHGKTPREVLGVLEELWTILWPDDRPFSPVPQTVHGQAVVGIVGAPPATVGGSADLWRIVEMVPIQIPTHLIGPSDLARSAKGEDIATMTLAAACIRQTITTPSIAMRVSVDDTAFEVGTIEVQAGSAVVRTQPNGGSVTGVSLLFTTYPTIADIRGAIDALTGLSVTTVDASLDARPSTDLVALAQTDILGPINERDIAVV